MVRKSNPTIQKLVESRIELGKMYMQQSLPIMHINEDFNSNILTNLENKNKEVFRIIKNKVPAIWTDVIDEMITVYNKEDVYEKVKRTFDHAKTLSGDTDDIHFPLMIFTDANDKINCVVGGMSAMHDTIYLSNDAESLLKERYDILMEVKKDLDKKYFITPDSFPGGNSKKTQRKLQNMGALEDEEWSKVPLQLLFGKLLFDIAAKYNDAKPEDKDKVKDEISIWHDPAAVYNALNEIADTHRKTINVVFTTGGIEKRKASTKTTRSKDVAIGSNTTPAYQFSCAIRMYPSRYDFENMLKPEFMRDIMRLANIRTGMNAGVNVDDPSELTIPAYTDEEIVKASEEELMDMYEDMRTVNVKNSVLYSTGHTKDITQADTYSTFNHLFLIPDKVSHLYSIGNIPTSRDNRLEDIMDVDDDPYASAEPHDIESRYNEFISPDDIRHRRENFEIGRQPQHSSNKYYDNKLKAKEPVLNIHGNAGRSAEEIRLIRAARRRGMIRTSREVNDDTMRDKRADLWGATSEITKKTGNPKFNPKVYKDRYRKDISGYNVPTQIDASTGKPLPRKETLLRGYYHDFMASYDSFSDTGKATYDKLMMKLDTYAKDSNEYKFVTGFRKKLLDYYTVFDAAVEAAYNVITTTGGNAKLYNEFCGNLATGSEVNGFFLTYTGAPDRSSIVQSINDALRSNNKYQKNSLELVDSNMEDLIEKLNKVLDTLCADQREKDYLMLTARRKYKV